MPAFQTAQRQGLATADLSRRQGDAGGAANDVEEIGRVALLDLLASDHRHRGRCGARVVFGHGRGDHGVLEGLIRALSSGKEKMPSNADGMARSPKRVEPCMETSKSSFSVWLATGRRLGGWLNLFENRYYFTRAANEKPEKEKGHASAAPLLHFCRIHPRASPELTAMAAEIFLLTDRYPAFLLELAFAVATRCETAAGAAFVDAQVDRHAADAGALQGIGGFMRACRPGSSRPCSTPRTDRCGR